MQCPKIVRGRRTSPQKISLFFYSLKYFSLEAVGSPFFLLPPPLPSFLKSRYAAVGTGEKEAAMRKRLQEMGGEQSREGVARLEAKVSRRSIDGGEEIFISSDLPARGERGREEERKVV